MILVEAGAGGDWDSRTDWAGLADRAVRAAVATSRYGVLVESDLAIEVSVKLTSDAEVQALNAGYRGKDKRTNVLSFPMVEPGLLDALARADGGEVLLGDIVLAHDVCATEAAQRGMGVEPHATHLIVHGTLHLLGYDHEIGDAEAEAMEQVERDALRSLDIADPYAQDEVKSPIHG